MEKQLCMSKNWKILDNESPREHASSFYRSESFAMKNGYSYEWINGQKPHLIKNGIRIQCNTENFVPIVVPGLSTISSSSSHPSTSMTPSSQEIDHPTSSSSSSTSPTVTSSTVSNDSGHSETREREDQSESDTSPVLVSSFNVDDPLFAVNPITSKVAKPTKKNQKQINKRP